MIYAWTLWASAAALSVILVISSVLMIWCEYDDGVVGKGALFVMWLGAAAFLLNLMHGVDYYPPPYATAMHIGVAVFMLRHLYRFLRWRRRRNWT